jgi:hypothetical protein
VTPPTSVIAAAPEAPLDRALHAAERDHRRIMLEAGWPRWAINLLAEPICEITVGVAWREWKHEISAWQRPEGGR